MKHNFIPQTSLIIATVLFFQKIWLYYVRIIWVDTISWKTITKQCFLVKCMHYIIEIYCFGYFNNNQIYYNKIKAGINILIGVQCDDFHRKLFLKFQNFCHKLRKKINILVFLFRFKSLNCWKYVFVSYGHKNKLINTA